MAAIRDKVERAAAAGTRAISAPVPEQV
jgi:hypothetical protein